MDNKTKIIIIAVAVIVIVAIVINGGSKKKIEEAQKENTNSTSEQAKASVKLDEDSGEYIVYDENGKEITRVMDEASAQIYIDNPDYDPKLPVSSYTESDTGMTGEQVAY